MSLIKPSSGSGREDKTCVICGNNKVLATTILPASVRCLFFHIFITREIESFFTRMFSSTVLRHFGSKMIPKSLILFTQFRSISGHIFSVDDAWLPIHIPLDFATFGFSPENFANQPSSSKTALRLSSVPSRKKVVSSAYCITLAQVRPNFIPRMVLLCRTRFARISAPIMKK